MLDLRRLTAAGVVGVAVSLVNATATLTCFSAEGRSYNFVRIASLAVPRTTFDAPQVAHSVGFTKDGKRLAALCNLSGFRGFGTVFLWDVETRKCVLQIGALDGKRVVLKPDEPMQFLSYFSTKPNARRTVKTNAGLEIQDDLSLVKKRLVPLKSLDSSTEIEQQGVYFSPDDKYIAAVRKDDRSISVWNMQDGQHLWRFALPGMKTVGIRSLAFDPSDSYLAAGLDQYVRPGVIGSVIVWNLRTGREVFHATQEYRVFQVAFSSQGELISGESGNGLDEPGRITVRRVDGTDDALENARIIHTPCGVWSLAIVSGVGIVSGDTHGQVLLWSIQTGRLLAVAKESGQQVMSLDVSRDGRLVASGDSDSTVRVWKIMDADVPKESTTKPVCRESDSRCGTETLLMCPAR